MKAKNILQKGRYVFFEVALLMALITATSAMAAGGVLDTNFGTNGIVTADLGGPSDNGVNLVVLPNGKIILSVSGNAPGLVRYNPNGTLDTNFGTNGKVATSISGPVALQPDGKLVVGGAMSGGVGLTRFNGNGTLDTTFGDNGVMIVWGNDNSNIRFSFGDLVIQPDGKIVVAGYVEAIGGHTVGCVIVRYHGNGEREEDSGGYFDQNNFPESGRNFCQAVALQSNGQILLSGQAEPNFSGQAIILGRMISGSTNVFDTSFGTNGHGTAVTPIASFKHARGALVTQADGKIVLAGTSYSNNDENLVLARYNSSGTLDTTLGGAGIVITDFGKKEVGNDIAIQPDGKIILAGRSYDGSSSDFLLVRYNLDGTLDTTFGDGGKVVSDFGGSESAAGILLKPGGKLFVSGSKDGDGALSRYVLDATSPITATFKSNALHDGWILESTETSGVGGSLDKTASTLNVGDNSKDKQYLAILSFNTDSLPDNAILTSVQLRIKKQGLTGTDPFNTHGDLLLEIRKGLFNNDLALTLADFAFPSSPPDSNPRDFLTPATGGWYTASLNNANLPYVNKIGKTQFRLRFTKDDNDDLGADYLKFYSGDASDANRPQLIVTYVVPQ